LLEPFADARMAQYQATQKLEICGRSSLRCQALEYTCGFNLDDALTIVELHHGGAGAISAVRKERDR